MFWDANYYGGHTSNAVPQPETRWIFAEGFQGFFDTFVLIANANSERDDGDAHVPARAGNAGGPTVQIAPLRPQDGLRGRNIPSSSAGRSGSSSRRRGR